MKRAIGYYWVKRSRDLAWEIAHYGIYLDHGARWSIVSDTRLLSDDYFYAIDPIEISERYYPKTKTK